jgi:hypothetical protein
MHVLTKVMHSSKAQEAQSKRPVSLQPIIRLPTELPGLHPEVGVWAPPHRFPMGHNGAQKRSQALPQALWSNFVHRRILCATENNPPVMCCSTFPELGSDSPLYDMQCLKIMERIVPIIATVFTRPCPAERV